MINNDNHNCADEDHVTHDDCDMYCHLTTKEGKEAMDEMKHDFLKDQEET